MSPAARRGFTLIELMIVVAIVGILTAGLVPVLPRYLRQLLLMNQAKAEIALSAQTSLYLLANDIRSAAAVEGEWQGLKGGDGCLILRLPADGTDADRIVYSVDPRDPRRLVKQVFTSAGSGRHAARQLLARNLGSLRFSVSEPPAGGKLVAYELSFASGYQKRMFRETFRGAAGLRNAR